jgi:hypothetical protein
MLPTAPQPPVFPVFESFVGGLRLVHAHRRLFFVLSFLPFIVTLVTMVTLRLVGDSLDMFWLPVIQLPSSFVIGLQCALILRFVLLAEYPLQADSPEKAERNRAAIQSAVVYGAITYFITGAYAGLLRMRAFMTVNPEAAAPYVPLIVAALVLLLWASRWFWLHVPIALGWSVSGFYERLGRWQGSLRIFGLFAVCSLTINVIAGFFRVLVAVISGGKPGGFVSAFDDAIVSGATVMLAVLFTAATSAAIKIMMRDSQKKAAA